MARIYRDRLYCVAAKVRSPSTGEWGVEHKIVPGYAMRHRGYAHDSFSEFRPRPGQRFRLHNGRLAEYQPIIGSEELRAALAPSSIAVEASLL